VGVSPEWHLAMATTAFFETELAERAAARLWSRDFAMRDLGYVRPVRLGQHVYRLTICRGDTGYLKTFFTSQLGAWDSRARAELDKVRSKAEVERELPSLLVLHGFADEPKLLACAARVGCVSSSTLRDGLKRLRNELAFTFKTAVTEDDPKLRGVLATGFKDLVAETIAARAAGDLRGQRWEHLLARLQERSGLSGRALFKPLRFALTGRLQGHDLRELVDLLELCEAGAPWNAEFVPLDHRISTLSDWLASQHDQLVSV